MRPTFYDLLTSYKVVQEWISTRYLKECTSQLQVLYLRYLQLAGLHKLIYVLRWIN